MTLIRDHHQNVREVPTRATMDLVKVEPLIWICSTGALQGLRAWQRDVLKSPDFIATSTSITTNNESTPAHVTKVAVFRFSCDIRRWLLFGMRGSIISAKPGTFGKSMQLEPLSTVAAKKRWHSSFACITLQVDSSHIIVFCTQTCPLSGLVWIMQARCSLAVSNFFSLNVEVNAASIHSAYSKDNKFQRGVGGDMSKKN